MRGRKRDAVIGPNHLRESKLLERALEDREGELLLGGQQRLARQEVATGEVGDRQGIAVPAIPEEKLPFVIGTPQRIRLCRARELGSRGAWAPPASMMHQAVAIEHGVDRADGGQVRPGELLPKFLPDFGRTPARVLPLQTDDRGFNRRREPIRLAVRAGLRSLKAWTPQSL